MVGLQTLDLPIGVRVPASQPQPVTLDRCLRLSRSNKAKTVPRSGIPGETHEAL